MAPELVNSRSVSVLISSLRPSPNMFFTLAGGLWEVERKPVAHAFNSSLYYDFNTSHAWGELILGDQALAPRALPPTIPHVNVPPFALP